MAYVIDDKERLAPTWLAAVKYLANNGRDARNLVLEMSNPGQVTAADRQIIKAVDSRLRDYSAAHPNKPELSVNTVAATIFPQGLYNRVGQQGRENFYQSFLKLMASGKKSGTWGTYAMRMVERVHPTKGAIRPIDQIVEKFQAVTNGGTGYQSNYELGMHECTADFDREKQAASELPITNPFRDTRPLNIPCLSHVTFKLVDGDKIDMTAIYRSHYYCQRALGNLIGLAQLQRFVAKESGLQAGMMTIISTYAKLDLENWGSVAPGLAFIDSL